MQYRQATSVLLLLVAITGGIGWALLFAVGPSGIMFGWTAILLLVTGLGAYVSPRSVRQASVWQVWLVLSGVGMLVNTYALIIQTSFWLSFGFLHPWFVVLGIGYLFNGAYRWNDPRLPRPSRYLFVVAGILSFLSLGFVIGTSSDIQQMTLILAVLTAVPPLITAVRFHRMD